MNLTTAEDTVFFRCSRDYFTRESECMLDWCESEHALELRYFTTDEYATPLRIREQWALSWCDLSWHDAFASII